MKKSSLKDSKNKWNKKEVKALYMDFPHLEWTLFAESLGWNPARSRSEFPVATWIEEKKRILAKANSEEIKEALFNLRGKYHLNITRTLEIYPALADQLFDLVKKKIDALTSSDDPQDIPTPEIVQLAKAFSIITDSKYKALLLDKINWSPDMALKDTEESSLTGDQKQSNQEWVIEVMGGERLTAAELQKELNSWYDSPQNVGESTASRIEDSKGDWNNESQGS